MFLSLLLAFLCGERYLVCGALPSAQRRSGLMLRRSRLRGAPSRTQRRRCPSGAGRCAMWQVGCVGLVACMGRARRSVLVVLVCWPRVLRLG